MGRQTNRRNDVRRLLAQEAARIMAEEGVRDFFTAKRKAADRLGIKPQHGRNIPTNLEIEEAVAEHHRLFRSDSQPERLRELREVARRAMLMFDGFRPRLVGGVLSGNAPRDAAVHLHLFADTPEQVAFHLMGRAVPYESSQRRLRLSGGGFREYPVFRFVAGDVGIDAT
ncbi:MAG: hypothetical protein PVI56_03760, partial [Gammaproteobacteria bacterium]